MDSHSPERRKQRRVPHRCEVDCDSFRNGTISDLSINGAFIDSLSATPVGAKLSLKFKIKNHEIRLTSEVRYNIPQIGMGVHFDALTQEQEAVLAELIWEKTALNRYE